MSDKLTFKLKALVFPKLVTSLFLSLLGCGSSSEDNANQPLQIAILSKDAKKYEIVFEKSTGGVFVKECRGSSRPPDPNCEENRYFTGDFIYRENGLKLSSYWHFLLLPLLNQDGVINREIEIRDLKKRRPTIANEQEDRKFEIRNLERKKEKIEFEVGILERRIGELTQEAEEPLEEYKPRRDYLEKIEFFKEQISRIQKQLEDNELDTSSREVLSGKIETLRKSIQEIENIIQVEGEEFIRDQRSRRESIPRRKKRLQAQVQEKNAEVSAFWYQIIELEKEVQSLEEEMTQNKERILAIKSDLTRFAEQHTQEANSMKNRVLSDEMEFTDEGLPFEKKLLAPFKGDYKTHKETYDFDFSEREDHSFNITWTRNQVGPYLMYIDESNNINKSCPKFSAHAKNVKNVKAIREVTDLYFDEFQYPNQTLWLIVPEEGKQGKVVFAHAETGYYRGFKHQCQYQKTVYVEYKK